MPLFDDDEVDDRRQRTKAPPGKPARGGGGPVKELRPPQPPTIAALTSSEPDPEFDFNESSSSAAARRAAAISRIGLADPTSTGNQEGGAGKAQRASLDLAAVKAANAERQNHLDAITVKKLLRERKDEESNPELVQVDREVGQYVTPSYAKRISMLRKTHGDLLAGAEEAEEEYYSSLTAKPKQRIAPPNPSPIPPPDAAEESTGPTRKDTADSASEQKTFSEEVLQTSPASLPSQLPPVPAPPPTVPPTQDVVSEYRKAKESLDVSRKARREARAHRQLADSFVNEQRRLYEEEKALRMRQMNQFIRLHPELVKPLPSP